jgi:hypothetical protein
MIHGRIALLHKTLESVERRTTSGMLRRQPFVANLARDWDSWKLAQSLATLAT